MLLKLLKLVNVLSHGVKVLLRDQESRVINGGTTTKCFSFGRGTC